MKKKINVALVFDENYVNYACVTIESLLKNLNHTSEVSFFCVTNNLSDASKKKIECLLTDSKNTIIWANPDNKLVDLSHNAINLNRFPSIVWYKVFLPFILPEEINEVLFIDTDILINGDIASFYYSTLSCMKETVIAGALDRASDKLAKTFNLEKYINSGVILFDCKRIREKWTLDKYINLFENAYNSIDIIFPDQDVINIMFDDLIYLIDMKYNFSKVVDKEYTKANKTSVKEAVIIHFVGGEKPWNADYCGPFAFKYLRYYYKYSTFLKTLRMIVVKIILKMKSLLLHEE